ncbi:MAG: arginase family protein [Thermoanaerobaculia bacterium]
MVVLLVGFERTTSYGKGTSAGPAAILRASQSMELWDEELGAEPCDVGIATRRRSFPTRSRWRRRWPRSRPSATGR